MLSLKKKLSQHTGIVEFCHLQTSNRIAINNYFDSETSLDIIILLSAKQATQKKYSTIIRLEGLSSVRIEESGNLDECAIQFLKKYLPYVFSSHFAKQKNRALAVAHFAQSLDGRIATSNGDSKWIGNQENLIHAHRMRALCDAILIGRGTLEQDQPRLTVRHVIGQNPIRVVLGNTAKDYNCLYESSTDRILVIGKQPSSLNGQIDYVHLDSEEAMISPRAILQCLYQRGITAVYVEGGSKTTSHFLETGAIDVLQLHFAPLLLGGGMSSISIPGINKVEHAIRFKNAQFHSMGDEIMFVGEFQEND